jgi:hypothetical protein
VKITPLISAGAIGLAAILSTGAALAPSASAFTLITPLAGTDLGAASYSLAAGTSATFQAQYWNTVRRFESVSVTVTGKYATVSPASIVLPASGAKVPVTVTVKVPAGTPVGSVADSLVAQEKVTGKTVTFGFKVVVTDTTPPSVPTGLKAALANNNSQVNLNWSASADNVGVAGYQVYRDGSPLAKVTGTSYADTAVSPGTTYAYTVAAYDSAGNVSAQTAPVSAVVPAAVSCSAYDEGYPVPSWLQQYQVINLESTSGSPIPLPWTFTFSIPQGYTVTSVGGVTAASQTGFATFTQTGTQVTVTGSSAAIPARPTSGEDGNGFFLGYTGPRPLGPGSSFSGFAVNGVACSDG